MASTSRKSGFRRLSSSRRIVVVVVPPIVLVLAQYPAVDRYDLSLLRWLGCGAAPLDADLQQTIAAAVEVQASIVASLQKLLGRLDEWNDFQDLVQEARALREKQRDVQNRTEDLRGRK